jgi:hypothetical protein
VDFISRNGQLELEPQRRGRFTAIVEIGLIRIFAVRHITYRVAHPLLGAIEQRGQRGADRGYAEAPGHGVQPPLGDAARAFHRAQVTAPILRLAHVCEQQIHYFCQPHPAPRDTQTRNAYTFLVNVGGAAGKAPRHHAADVLPVRHHAHDRERLVVVEHWIEQPNVIQVRPAGVRIVMQEQVAGTDIAAVLLDQRTRRPRQRGDVCGLLELGGGYEIAGGTQHRRREIVTFDDHARISGADDDRAHLTHDRREPRLDQLDGDRIDSDRRLHRYACLRIRSGNQIAHQSRRASAAQSAAAATRLRTFVARSISATALSSASDLPAATPASAQSLAFISTATSHARR